MTEITDMPILQAEDDGFLLELKKSVLESHLETLGIEDFDSIEDCINKILSDSESAVDRGSSLPLYVPVRDDTGVIQVYKAVPVWSGVHIDVPLYGNLCPEKVKSLITGNRSGATNLYDGFMTYSPAFRVALLVHHICQIVLMNPLAAEAFVLGRYEELPLDDKHYKQFGVPSTDLVMVESNAGLREEWTALTPKSLVGYYRALPRINGWIVRVRGSQPKEALLHESWEEIRSRLDEPKLQTYTIGGVAVKKIEPTPSGRTRKRAGDPDVDLLYEWIEDKLQDGSFPMRGEQKDWKKAILQFGECYQMYADRWTSDGMRKAYEGRRRRNAQYRRKGNVDDSMC